MPPSAVLVEKVHAATCSPCVLKMPPPEPTPPAAPVPGTAVKGPAPFVPPAPPLPPVVLLAAKVQFITDRVFKFKTAPPKAEAPGAPFPPLPAFPLAFPPPPPPVPPLPAVTELPRKAQFVSVSVPRL